MYATNAIKQLALGMHSYSQRFIRRAPEHDMILVLHLISSALLTDAFFPRTVVPVVPDTSQTSCSTEVLSLPNPKPDSMRAQHTHEL